MALSSKVVRSVVLIAGLIVISIAVALYILRHPPKQPTPGEAMDPRVEVQVQAIQPRVFQRKFTLWGTVHPKRQAAVAAGVAGDVQWVSPQCEPGEMVEAGQALLRLDERTFRAVFEEARAQVAEAQAALALQRLDNAKQEKILEQLRQQVQAARASLQRFTTLRQRETISQAELDREQERVSDVVSRFVQQREQVRTAAAQLERAEAALGGARARQDRSRADLERTTIRAPFSGRIMRREVDTGDRVTVGQPVFHLGQFREVRVAVEIPSSRLALVHKGVKATVRLPQASRQWEGRLVHLAPSGDPETRLFPAEVAVENTTAPLLLGGQFVAVECAERGPKRYMAVPLRAIGQDDEGDYVFVVQGEPLRAVRRSVQRLWFQDGEVLVTGLQPGDRVVVEGQADLSSGTAVKVGRS